MTESDVCNYCGNDDLSLEKVEVAVDGVPSGTATAAVCKDCSETSAGVTGSDVVVDINDYEPFD